MSAIVRACTQRLPNRNLSEAMSKIIKVRYEEVFFVYGRLAVAGDRSLRKRRYGARAGRASDFRSDRRAARCDECGRGGQHRIEGRSAHLRSRLLLPGSGRRVRRCGLYEFQGRSGPADPDRPEARHRISLVLLCRLGRRAVQCVAVENVQDPQGGGGASGSDAPVRQAFGFRGAGYERIARVRLSIHR